MMKPTLLKKNSASWLFLKESSFPNKFKEQVRGYSFPLFDTTSGSGFFLSFRERNACLLHKAALAGPSYLPPDHPRFRHKI